MVNYFAFRVLSASLQLRPHEGKIKTDHC
jgi:hypothetical protein